MRILMINHEFTVSGASRAFFRLAVALKANGHQLTLFPIDARHGPMRNEFLAIGIPIREEINAPEFDLVIANTICAAPALVEIGTRMKTIWWVHEAEAGLELILQNPAWIAAFRLATAIVFQTRFQQDDIFRPFLLSRSPRHTVIIQNAVAPLPDDPVADAAVAPVGEGIFRVISVGTIEPRKRHADLVNAVALLPRCALECVICGRYFDLAPQAAAVIRAAPTRYRLLGELSETAVRAWMKSAHLFCLPSASESQPLAALEAASLGKPLLLTDLPCYRDMFTHGRNAIMVPPGDVELLSMAIEGLASRPELRTRLGNAARQAVRPNTEQRLLAEFDSLLNLVVPPIP